MTKVVILGANGQLARNTTRLFLERTDARLTLYLRRANRLRNPDPTRVTIVEGDVLDRPTLDAATRGHDVVYADLAGPMAEQARVIVAAMRTGGPKRLIFISSMGIYGEVPGLRYRSVLDPHRDSPRSSKRPTSTTRSCDRAGSRTTKPSTTRSRRKASRFAGTTCR